MIIYSIIKLNACQAFSILYRLFPVFYVFLRKKKYIQKAQKHSNKSSAFFIKQDYFAALTAAFVPIHKIFPEIPVETSFSSLAASIAALINSFSSAFFAESASLK